MKNNNIIKYVAAILMVIAMGVTLTETFTAEAVVKQKIKVQGIDGTELGNYPVSSVSYLEFVDEEVYPDANVDANGNIIIELSPTVKFKMICVEGGVDYTLRGNVTSWPTESRTKAIETFYLGEFEVTQGVWNAVKGSVPDGQSAIGDNYPVACISWNDVMGTPTSGTNFITDINKLLAEIKGNDPAIASLLGSREFRLPNEWEWEYAAAGGKNWESLNYLFPGTSENSLTALQSVAVYSLYDDDAQLPNVAVVGSKLPNALGFYDMAGNVIEYCSGLGYYEHESTPGYLNYDYIWKSNARPIRGGSWTGADFKSQYMVTYRAYVDGVNEHKGGKGNGFRLAL